MAGQAKESLELCLWSRTERLEMFPACDQLKKFPSSEDLECVSGGQSAGAERGMGDACSRLIRANALQAAEDATLTALFPGETGSKEKKGGMKMFPADTCRAYLTFIHQESPL